MIYNRSLSVSLSDYDESSGSEKEFTDSEDDEGEENRRISWAETFATFQSELEKERAAVRKYVREEEERRAAEERAAQDAEDSDAAIAREMIDASLIDDAFASSSATAARDSSARRMTNPTNATRPSFEDSSARRMTNPTNATRPSFEERTQKLSAGRKPGVIDMAMPRGSQTGRTTLMTHRPSRRSSVLAEPRVSRISELPLDTDDGVLASFRLLPEAGRLVFFYRRIEQRGSQNYAFSDAFLQSYNRMRPSVGHHT